MTDRIVDSPPAAPSGEWQRRAGEAWQACRIREEVVPVEVGKGKKAKLIEKDDHMRPETTMEDLAGLPTAFDKDGFLFLSVGDRMEGLRPEGMDPTKLATHHAQLLVNHQGKILRLKDDGTAPPDNPLNCGQFCWASAEFVVIATSAAAKQSRIAISSVLSSGDALQVVRLAATELVVKS